MLVLIFMKEDFDRSPYTKKSFELAYAMMRIGESLEVGSVRSRLEIFAHQILEVFTESQYEKVPNLLESVGWFVRLWTDSGIIHRHLGEALLVELSKLKNLAEEAEKEKSQVDDFYTLTPPSFGNSISVPSDDKPQPKKDRQIARNINKTLPDRLPNENNAHHYNSSSRQSAIIAFFKGRPSSGNILPVCRMKDIQESFPNVSERTLRYDLQKLVEEGVIDRVGAGPMSAYRLAKSTSPAVTLPPEDRYNSQLLQKEPLGEGTGKVLENSL